MSQTSTLPPLCEMRDNSISFGGIKAVDHVSIDLHPGEVVGLLGHNGAGKSTLIKCLSGAYQADHGEIYVNGVKVDIANTVMPGRSTSRRSTKPWPWQTTLTRPLTCFWVASWSRLTALSMKQDGNRGPPHNGAAEPELPQIQRAGVGPVGGGQRQSVAIARAVYFNAKILIMDELIAALGPHETQMVAELIQELNAQCLRIFLIEHDIHNVMKLCDRAVALKNGRRVGTVNVKDVTDDDILGMIIMGKKPASAV